MPDRAPSAEAGPDALSLSAACDGRDHVSQGLYGAARRERAMSEVPQVLLAHHLKALKLPTFLREYDKLARQCAAEGVDHTGYLLRLSELELLDRERRLIERRIRQARFPAVKSLDSFDFGALPSSGAELLFEVFSQRYERGSVLVTSNLPFEEWTSVFGSERLTGALLDRLTHHVHILEMNGESYRLKASRRRHGRSVEARDRA